ncbi:hypothetical protein [Sphingomonas montana]|nr:hypothetical protein [Sphingomonas montana]
MRTATRRFPTTGVFDRHIQTAELGYIRRRAVRAARVGGQICRLPLEAA